MKKFLNYLLLLLVVSCSQTLKAQDPYDILGVNRSASLQQIKNAYRRLALQWHPDRNPSTQATQKFQEINAAYDALKNSSQTSTTYSSSQDSYSSTTRGQSGQSSSTGGFGFQYGGKTYDFSRNENMSAREDAKQWQKIVEDLAEEARKAEAYQQRDVQRDVEEIRRAFNALKKPALFCVAAGVLLYFGVEYYKKRKAQKLAHNPEAPKMTWRQKFKNRFFSK